MSIGREENSKLKGDVGKLHKTHDKVCLDTAAGTSGKLVKNHEIQT